MRACYIRLRSGWGSYGAVATSPTVLRFLAGHEYVRRLRRARLVRLSAGPVRASGSARGGDLSLWAVTFMPLPMPRTVCITFPLKKCINPSEFAARMKFVGLFLAGVWVWTSRFTLHYSEGAEDPSGAKFPWTSHVVLRPDQLVGSRTGCRQGRRKGYHLQPPPHCRREDGSRGHLLREFKLGT